MAAMITEVSCTTLVADLVTMDIKQSQSRDNGTSQMRGHLCDVFSFQGSATIGQRDGMSNSDVNKLMSFYGC